MVRYGAEEVRVIPPWCHYSWERYYEIDVKAFILTDGRALAFCEMSGGGKHTKNLTLSDPPAPLETIEPLHVRQYLTWRKSAPVRASREKALLSAI